jgi:hypothetical protein
MTKEKYMALADFQALWSDKLKPWINGQKADKTDVAALVDAIGIDTDYEFVDLGLPSGTLWAKCNVGAETETGYGNYYKYGDGAGPFDYSAPTYDGTEDPLSPQYDTATQVWGKTYHTPTKAQIEELVANTIRAWVEDYQDSGINGFTFTAANGKHIFIPAAGICTDTASRVNERLLLWTSTPHATDSTKAYLAMGSISVWNITGELSRGMGGSIRPVMDGSIIHQLDDRYTKAEVDNMALATMFRLYVDPEDMHLKGRNIQDGTFEVVNGHLILHQN